MDIEKETTKPTKPTTTHNSDLGENKIDPMIQRKNKNMTRKLLSILLLLLLVGCEKDHLEIDRPNPDGSIGFRLKTEDAEIDIDNAQTRGTPQKSLEQYNSVCVTVYAHTSDYSATVDNDVTLLRELILNQDESNWKYSPSLFWPVDTKLSFVAYASDIPFANAGISFWPEEEAPKKITYKVPADVTKQPDLLVSTKFDQTKVDNVSLTMKHALACVSFCGIAPEGKTFVKSISLRNVCSEGTFTLDDFDIKWTVNLDSKGIIVFQPGIKDDQELGEAPLKDNNYLMTKNGYLMMVPQRLTNAAIDVLYWDGINEAEGKIITYILPVDDESYATWQPGKQYIYKFGTQSEKDITVVYYEKYTDDTYGLYYYENGNQQNTIIDSKEIVEAGYGVLSKKNIGSVGGIKLSSPTTTAVTSGTVVELTDLNSFLYPVSQSAGSTFNLPASSTPIDVYFNNSTKSCGMIVPHFAKGVYTERANVIEHDIRTPQQMRNITSLPVSATQNLHTYTQERDLDFSKKAIGGGTLTTSVVNRNFNDLFQGKNKRIENVDINAPSVNGGLFLSNSGVIKEVTLLNSSILATSNTGGIAAINETGGVITHSRIIGEIGKQLSINGISGYTGGIAGYNSGKIIGNTTMETATEIPIAEVSGWVSITGSTAGTGGITGENMGTITTCLVNGVYVRGGTVQEAKITIEGVEYVGGIVGGNKARVDGNFTTENGKTIAQPDVAGVVSISSSGNWVGGIAGINRGTNAVLNQVNIRLGRGDANKAITIKGAQSVGGIVGANEDGGTLKADRNSFISVRGNIYITGTSMVGGIVGNNQSGNLSNCFVYNFYSQTSPLTHYAPKISGTSLVGGIAGYAGNSGASIQNCTVFSTVSDDNKGATETATQATVEIKASTESAGGIVGRAFSGLRITANYVLGNVKIEGQTQFSGGIVGQNDTGTSISSVHIGSSGTEVSGVYTNLFDMVNLPVRDERMKTNGDVMTKTSGTPTIIGGKYIGGICGVNWGAIEGVSINDNVKIGTPTSYYVGGIAGGTGVNATITNCKTYNPATGDATVQIEGYMQTGGIVGLNNGIVDKCQLGWPGLNQSRLITIKATSKLGGIAGSNGGLDGEYPSGNTETRITNCNVYGKVLIDGSGGEATGGIIGENLAPSRVLHCNVTGYTSSGTNRNGYDVTIKSSGNVGGIAGANYGHIYGTSTTYSKVTHTAVITSFMHAGGLVGFQQSTTKYPGLLYYCDVSQGVLVDFDARFSGALVGQLDGTKGADSTTPVVFGTTFNGVINRIYTGPTNPVIINGNNTSVMTPPKIEDVPKFYPEIPFAPTPATGNLWTRYAPYNYLHYTTYTN